LTLRRKLTGSDKGTCREKGNYYLKQNRLNWSGRIGEGKTFEFRSLGKGLCWGNLLWDLFLPTVVGMKRRLDELFDRTTSPLKK